MSKIFKVIKANLGRSSGLGGAVPSDIEFLPAGIHENVQFSNLDELKKLGLDLSAIIVDENTAAELEAQLQGMLEKVKAGEASRPFIDFDHEGKKAAGFPLRFFWQDGVRLEVEWTREGRSSIEGKDYNYFSPEFYIDKLTGHVCGIPEVGQVGALCNLPAFQNIEKISAKLKEGVNMTEEEIKQLVEEKETLETQLNTITEERDQLKEDLAKLQDSAKASGDDDEKVKEAEAAKAKAEEEAEDAKKEVEAMRKTFVTEKVEGFVRAGRLDASKKEGVIKAALASKDNGAAFFDALPENPLGEYPIKGNRNIKDSTASGVARASAGFAKLIKEGKTK